jgi:hypothetical protein
MEKPQARGDLNGSTSNLAVSVADKAKAQAPERHMMVMADAKNVYTLIPSYPLKGTIEPGK